MVANIKLNFENSSSAFVPDPRCGTIASFDLSIPPQGGSDRIDMLRYSMNMLWYGSFLGVHPDESLRPFTTLEGTTRETLKLINPDAVGWNDTPYIDEPVSWIDESPAPDCPPTFIGNLRRKADIQIAPFYHGPGLQNVPLWWTDNDKWIEFVVNNFDDKTYQDLVSYATTLTLFDKIDQSAGGGIPDNYIKIEPSYKFYIESYENLLASQPSIPGVLLPNMYVFLSEMGVEGWNSINQFILERGSLDWENSIYERFINLREDAPRPGASTTIEHIKGQFIDILRTPLSVPGGPVFIASPVNRSPFPKISEKDLGHYYDKWSKAITELIRYRGSSFFNVFGNMINSYSNLVIPTSNLRLLQEIKDKEELFPMNIKVDFTSEVADGGINKKLKEEKLRLVLLKDILELEPMQILQSALGFENWVDPEGKNLSCEWLRNVRGSDENYYPLKAWDIGKWVDCQLTLHQPRQALHQPVSTNESVARPWEVLLGGYTDEFGVKDPLNPIEFLSRLGNFKEWLERFTAAYFRYVEDLIVKNIDHRVAGSGRQRSGPNHPRAIGEHGSKHGRRRAYSETIFYKMCRHTYNGDTITEEPEQCIWFPNDDEAGLLSYMDSQVKYGVRYAYRIYAYRMVIGNEYNYKINSLPTPPPPPGPIKFFPPPVLGASAHHPDDIPPGGRAATGAGSTSSEPWFDITDSETWTGLAPVGDEYTAVLPIDQPKEVVPRDTGPGKPEDAPTLGARISDMSIKYAGSEAKAKWTLSGVGSTKKFPGGSMPPGGLSKVTPPPSPLDFPAPGSMPPDLAPSECCDDAGTPDPPTTWTPVPLPPGVPPVIREKLPEPECSPPWQFLSRLCVFNKPSVQLIELPYYFSEWDIPGGIRITDNPPVSPDVNVVPLIGADDKVLIWLNGTVGDYFGNFEALLDTDTVPQGTRVHFKSDDPVQEFEIFRISEKPLSYRDFSGVIPARVSSPGASSAAFTDKFLRPNRKYYYTFRAIDVHGQTSNPTDVYEVELVKTDGNVYVLIRTIDMPLVPERQITKPAKRFIQIKPSFLQTILDTKKLEEARGPTDIQGLDFKNPGASIWGSGNSNIKKFKVRLNSKKSGKKLDINLKFKIVNEVHIAPTVSVPTTTGLPTLEPIPGAGI